MANIELQEINDSLYDKIHRIKSYRLSLNIKSDIEDFIHNHYDNGLSMFRFNTFVFNATLILEKYDIKFNIEYEYEKTYDIYFLVKITINNNFVLNIRFLPETDFHV
jgi:hypothetical protein